MKKSSFTAQKRGFAMLFAVLVSSVLLSIGISIFNLTIKELTLSSSGRESQFAFYAADTGAECAFYWDIRASYPALYATSSGSQAGFWRDSYVDSNNPTCVGKSIAYEMKNASSTAPSSATTRFSLSIPNTLPSGASAPYCAIVSVTKTESSGVISTTIDSRGYNTCDATDPNRVERALKVTY